MNNSKKKIAFIATLYKHLADFSLPHMKLLQSLDYEVHVYAYKARRKQDLESIGVICHDLPLGRNPFNWQNVSAIRKLIKSLKKENFEMIHCHTPMGGVAGRIAGKFAQVPSVIYTAHGFHFFRGSSRVSWLFYHTVEKWLAKWTDYLILVNEEDYSIGKKFGVRKMVSWIPEHTSIKKFSIGIDRDGYRKKMNLNPSDFVFICVAELIPRKNHIQIIESLSRIIENRNSDSIKCLFVGEGELLDSLQEKVNNLGLKDIVKFLGFRKEVPELLKISDVGILVSYQEGLPVFGLESIASGLPFITTDIRGSQDLVSDYKNGIKVKPDDIEATVKAMTYMIEHRDTLREMGIKSKEMSLQYDESIILEKTKTVYEQALNI
jgi:glycosyltransferase involved in cell wall biosynthesis